jgi:hypothetical protein
MGAQMSTTTEDKLQSRTRARILLVEVAVAIYLPLLVIMVNSMRAAQHPARNSWVNDLQSLIAGNRSTSYYPAFGLLWVVSSAVLFLCLRMLARFSWSSIFLRTFAGTVAIAGFPLANGYISFRAYAEMLGSFPRAILYAYAPYRWLAVELMASLVGLLLCLSQKWLIRGWVLLPLFLHFAVWTWVALIGGTNFVLIYPLLGFFASLAWYANIQQSRGNALLSKPATVHSN